MSDIDFHHDYYDKSNHYNLVMVDYCFHKMVLCCDDNYFHCIVAGVAEVDDDSHHCERENLMVDYQ
jgi:hypothetical protein